MLTMLGFCIWIGLMVCLLIEQVPFFLSFSDQRHLKARNNGGNCDGNTPEAFRTGGIRRGTWRTGLCVPDRSSPWKWTVCLVVPMCSSVKTWGAHHFTYKGLPPPSRPAFSCFKAKPGGRWTALPAPWVAHRVLVLGVVSGLKSTQCSSRVDSYPGIIQGIFCPVLTINSPGTMPHEIACIKKVASLTPKLSVLASIPTSSTARVQHWRI